MRREDKERFGVVRGILVYSSTANGVNYGHAAWQLQGEDSYDYRFDTCNSKKEALGAIKRLNSLVITGEYAPRPLLVVKRA